MQRSCRILRYGRTDSDDSRHDQNQQRGIFAQLLNVRLAGYHMYGKLLFTWLSLVMSMIVSFYAVLFLTRSLG